ncbi:hypothetical protein SAMN02745823_02531 [Sporobacter termitidis DSM 10068]|uniref:Deacetylase PdaC domain-containing protein n=1 Tax=Sporobacter termitidis DSM 10068 TaxID=1123282 RepID=A0A1M5YH70_9FIRM|nr:hypothetical protein [Sporobacter termitidis]SHI11356.1 hypothetical protein SAMN02745823_02531 [Sporobacter termitidis DSM 10068]
MSQFKKHVKKIWIVAAAVLLIVGSTSAMAYALNSAVPGTALNDAVTSAPAVSLPSQAPGQTALSQPLYTVDDRSTQLMDFEQFKNEVKMKMQITKQQLTPEQIEKIYEDYITSATPGDKDMTADQAAARGAALVQTAYGVDLAGYTAVASFSKSPLPYSDNWSILFHAPDETDSSNRYIADINSVTGAILDIGCFNLDYTEIVSKDVQDPDWIATAERDIAKLLPSGVTITGSKVVYATENVGVTVVCALSDGSAFAVRLAGDGKAAQVYVNFPNGYDGSLDYKPLSEDAVG